MDACAGCASPRLRHAKAWSDYRTRRVREDAISGDADQEPHGPRQRRFSSQAIGCRLLLDASALPALFGVLETCRHRERLLPLDGTAPASPTFAQHQAAPAAFRQPSVVAGSYADSQTGDAMNKRRKRFPINREAYDLLMAGTSNSEGTPPERLPSSALRRCAIVAIRPPPAGCRWLAVVAISASAALRTGPRSRRRRPASRSQDRTRNASRPVPPP